MTQRIKPELINNDGLADGSLLIPDDNGKGWKPVDIGKSQNNILHTDGSGNPQWGQPEAEDYLSGQAGSQGQVLTTDGNNASWDSISSGIGDAVYFDGGITVASTTLNTGTYTVSYQQAKALLVVVDFWAGGQSGDTDVSVKLPSHSNWTLVFRDKGESHHDNGVGFWYGAENGELDVRISGDNPFHGHIQLLGAIE